MNQPCAPIIICEKQFGDKCLNVWLISTSSYCFLFSVSAKDSMSTKVQPSSKLQKPLVAAADIFPAVIAGTIMIWVIITELSVLTYALSTDKNVLGFVSEYYSWRDTAPIISKIVFIIACLFPVALLQCTVAFFQIFTRSASSTSPSSPFSARLLAPIHCLLL